MRPIHLVLDQIRWDPRLDPARFAVVWEDRAGGEQTEPVSAWRARGDVPQHRIRRLLHDGRPVWDRATGEDRLAAVAEGQAEVHTLSAVAVWNLLDDDTLSERVDAVADQVLRLPAEIVGLIEVADPVERALTARLPAGRRLERRGTIGVVLPGDRPWTVVALPLPGRDALLATSGDLAVAVAHLTSDVRGDRGMRREEQLDALAAAVPRHGALVVLLDANSEDDLPQLVDVGLVDPGSEPTFDPNRNPRAVSRNPRARRLDRVLVRGLGVRFTEVVRPEPGLSDHFPLVAALGPPSRSDRWGRSAETALVVLPPADVAAALDAIRRGRDDAFDRWPAHVTVGFPFVAPAAVDEVEVALARATIRAERFTLELDGVDVFAHDSGRRTLWARPADDAGLRSVARAVDGVVPHLAAPDRTFHLTLSTGAAVELSPTSFAVEQLAILAATAGRYEVTAWVPLGRASLAEAVAETGLVDDPSRWRAAADAVQAALPGRVQAVGGAADGVRLVGGDLDLAWEPPVGVLDALAFACAALAAYAPTRVEAVHAPRLKLRVDGLAVDLIPGAHDAISAVEDPVPTLALAAMKVWALRRGLTGPGMPASVGWRRLLVASGALEAERALVAVLDRLSRSSDLGAVSGSPFRTVDPGSLARVRREAARALALIDGADPAWRALLSPLCRPLS